MANNQHTSVCGGMQIDTCCKPDPITSAAAHDVTVANFGNDTYVVSKIVVAILGPTAGASLVLHNGTTLSTIVSWSAGTFGPNSHGKWSTAVKRQATGTTKAHDIQTTATYTSDAEADYLNNMPGPTRSCGGKVNVMVP